MTTIRTAIPDFQLANPLYIAAQVTFYTVDSSGAKTTTLATLYGGPIGGATLRNPQTLDSEGKFSAPVYIEQPVIGEVTGPSVASHLTGVIAVRGTWRGVWTANTVYFANDFVLDPSGQNQVYAVASDYTSGNNSAFSSELSAGKLILVLRQPDTTNTLPFPSVASVQGATIQGEVSAIQLNGYYSAGDGGAARYIRVDAQPAHPGAIRSIDRYLSDGLTVSNSNGGWWEIAENDINVKMLGAKGNNLGDQGSEILNAQAVCVAKGIKTLGVPFGSYKAPNLNTSDVTQLAQVIPIGEGTITGNPWGVRVFRPNDPTVEAVTKSILLNERYFTRTSLNTNPVAVLVGDSISTRFPAITTLETENLWTIFQRAMTAANPGKVFTFYDRAIGAQTFTGFDGVANANWPEWYPVDTRVLAYKAQTVNFTVGQVLTGGTSGAHGTISADSDGGATGTLTLTGVVGTFVDNEHITDAAGGAATANGADALRPWLAYLQDLAPDLVVIAFGVNDHDAFVAARVRDAIATIQTWAKVPDVAFITNTSPSRLLTGSDYAQWSSQNAQEGRDFVAGYVRSYCHINSFGLFDANRQFRMLRDGYDPTECYLEPAVSALAVATPYTAPVQCADFAWEMVFASNPLAGGRKLVGTSSFTGLNVQQFWELSDSGTGTVRLRVYELWSGTQTDNLNVDTGITIPTADIDYKLQFNQSWVKLWIGTTAPNPAYEGRCQRFGGLFIPTISRDDGSAVNFTASLFQGIYARTMPFMLDDEFYEAPGSNGINHPSTRGAKAVWERLFFAAAIDASYNQAQARILAGTTNTVTTNTENELLVVYKGVAGAHTINLPLAGARSRKLRVFDGKGVASGNPITMVAAGSDIIAGPNIINSNFGWIDFVPKKEGDGWYAFPSQPFDPSQAVLFARFFN